MSPSRITLAMIARNEERNLPSCLRSIAHIVDEIIVIDTGSTDATREVALSFGAKVIPFSWCDDFAAARNETLQHATGDWVLYLDADERLDDTNGTKLRRLLSEAPESNTAYVLIQRSLHPTGSTAVLLQQVRLFRRHPMVHWEYRVHEQLLPSLQQAGFEIRWTDITSEQPRRTSARCWLPTRGGMSVVCSSDTGFWLMRRWWKQNARLAFCRKQRPEAIEPLVDLATCTIERNDLGEARELLQGASERKPNSPQVLQEPATLYFRQERTEQATKTLEQLYQGLDRAEEARLVGRLGIR